MTAANAKRWRPKEALAAPTLRLRFSSGTFSSPLRARCRTPLSPQGAISAAAFLSRAPRQVPSDSRGGSFVRAFESPNAAYPGHAARASRGLSGRVVKVDPPQRESCIRPRCQQLSLLPSQALCASGRSGCTPVSPPRFPLSAVGSAPVTLVKVLVAASKRGGRGAAERPAFPASARSQPSRPPC